ncbi:MAG: acyl-CoA reductase [Verrucomicrobiota bacterium]|nr:acyl-CoA reductase [Verrucomicrobiota bacterium]
MISTPDRCAILAEVLSGFPELGLITSDSLLNLIQTELGSPLVLDGFVNLTGHSKVMAKGPGTILHVISGNVAQPGLLSLTFGLILKAHNLVKLPSHGNDRIIDFINKLPEPFSSSLEIVTHTNPEIIAKADVVIVYGNEETINHFQRVTFGKKALLYGPKLSYGIIFSEEQTKSIYEDAARDASVYNQQGCLSPHVFYVQENGPDSPRAFAEKLAAAMDQFALLNPPTPLSLAESSAVVNLRSAYRFRAANDPRVLIFESKKPVDWTVIFEEESQFATSCLNRTIFVKPFVSIPDLVKATELVRPYLSTIGCAPLTSLTRDDALCLAATRYCPIGKMQQPPLTWHHDGRPNLADLVTWIDIESTPN